MAPKICIPILPTSLAMLTTQLEEAKMVGELVEVYVDYLSDESDLVISEIRRVFTEAVITFRRPKFEPASKTTSIQQEILKIATDIGFMVDLDFVKESELTACALKQGSKLISSYHNYTCTPSLPELHSIIADMEAINPFGVKIACRCSDEADALRLLGLLIQKRKRFSTIIVSAMGENALPARVVGGLWGGAWVYAPLSKNEATAEGQITARDLRKIFESYEAR